jgi:hypothetical protein
MTTTLICLRGEPKDLARIELEFSFSTADPLPGF